MAGLTSHEEIHPQNKVQEFALLNTAQLLMQKTELIPVRKVWRKATTMMGTISYHRYFTAIPLYIPWPAELLSNDIARWHTSRKASNVNEYQFSNSERNFIMQTFYHIRESQKAVIALSSSLWCFLLHQRNLSCWPVGNLTMGHSSWRPGGKMPYRDLRGNFFIEEKSIAILIQEILFHLTVSSIANANHLIQRHSVTQHINH